LKSSADTSITESDIVKRIIECVSKSPRINIMIEPEIKSVELVFRPDLMIETQKKIYICEIVRNLTAFRFTKVVQKLTDVAKILQRSSKKKVEIIIISFRVSPTLKILLRERIKSDVKISIIGGSQEEITSGLTKILDLNSK